MTDPLKEALAWAETPFAEGHDCALTGRKIAAILAAAVRSRDKEIARLRLKPDGNHDRCNAGLRSLLKTAEEEIAGLRDALDKLGDKIDMIRDFECCDVSSEFCGWKESIAEVVSTFDAATKTREKL